MTDVFKTETCSYTSCLENRHFVFYKTKQVYFGLTGHPFIFKKPRSIGFFFQTISWFNLVKVLVSFFPQLLSVLVDFCQVHLSKKQFNHRIVSLKLYTQKKLGSLFILKYFPNLQLHRIMLKKRLNCKLSTKGSFSDYDFIASYSYK